MRIPRPLLKRAFQESYRQRVMRHFHHPRVSLFTQLALYRDAMTAFRVARQACAQRLYIEHSSFWPVETPRLHDGLRVFHKPPNQYTKIIAIFLASKFDALTGDDFTPPIALYTTRVAYGPVEAIFSLVALSISTTPRQLIIGQLRFSHHENNSSTSSYHATLRFKEACWPCCRSRESPPQGAASSPICLPIRYDAASADIIFKRAPKHAHGIRESASHDAQRHLLPRQRHHSNISTAAFTFCVHFSLPAMPPEAIIKSGIYYSCAELILLIFRAPHDDYFHAPPRRAYRIITPFTESPFEEKRYFTGAPSNWPKSSSFSFSPPKAMGFEPAEYQAVATQPGALIRQDDSAANIPARDAALVIFAPAAKRRGRTSIRGAHDDAAALAAREAGAESIRYGAVWLQPALAISR